MKKVITITIAIILILLVLSGSALAMVEYEGFSGYFVDGFVIFVPESWGGGSSDGRTLFLPDEADRALVANVRQMSGDDELTPEEYAELTYFTYFRLMGIDGLQQESITLNGDPAKLWYHTGDDGSITAGLVYLHGTDLLSLYYQVFVGEQDPELAELRSICEKVTPADLYYAE